MVFVISTDRQPLAPCHPARARKLLREGKAAVLRRFPFTIILKERTAEESATHLHRLKIDPGSKTTGLAILQKERVVFAAELEHRGSRITQNMTARRQLRRSRRSRKTRYRKPRFDNRTRPAGWLPPSLEHRVLTTETWVRRLAKLCPIDAISVERVRFDMQRMANPEITGVEYQQGELQGLEVKEYLLDKFDRTCAYCDATDVPLEVEHIRPRSKQGSNRVSNLTIACVPCNQAKDNRDIEDFLADRPERLARILAQVKHPLRDAAAVNATRNRLVERLATFGVPLETGTGARTKFNRKRAGLAKAHWTDAVCVGESTPERIHVATPSVLKITSTGHGTRQMCGTDRFGFPKRHRSRGKIHFGFQTGDIVRAVVPAGKKAGTHTGRVLCRATGSFDIKTASGRVAGIHHRHLHAVHRSDGYSYTITASHSSPRMNPGASCEAGR